MSKMTDQEAEALGRFLATEHPGAGKDSGTYCALKHGFQAGLAHARGEAEQDAARWKAFTSLDVDVYVNNFGMQWAGAGFAEGLQGLLDSLIADAAMEKK